MGKTGVIIGKFLPLHLGHVNFINRSSTKTDKLVVVVCHSSRDKKMCEEYGIPEITVKDRLRWLHTIYQDIPHIEIRSLDESSIPAYPDGWKEFVGLLKETVPEKIDFVYSGEPSYDSFFKELLPEAEHILIDPERTGYNISGTQIRKNPYKNWEYLPAVVRPFFCKKVVLIGTESCGKTTLTKFLAKAFNTSWAEEYGRNYVYEECGGNEDNLEYGDYIKIAMHQKKLEAEAVRHSNKIVFIDTEAIVTQFYCKLYEGKEDPAIDEIIKRQNYDLWLYLENDVKWVDDGLRKNGSDKERNKGKKILAELLEKYNIADKVKMISGNYEERLDKALEIIKGEFYDI
jgi:HTH-type transcriptional repressor of NAD biosynthesis genes